MLGLHESRSKLNAVHHHFVDLLPLKRIPYTNAIFSTTLSHGVEIGAYLSLAYR